MISEERAPAAHAARLEALLEEVTSLPDDAVRTKAIEIVQNLLALYGEGLARMLAAVTRLEPDTAGAALLDAFAADELISHLLLLHDLHPISLATRVTRALEEVRPYLRKHGGNVELLGLDGGVARLRLLGSCEGCPSSTLTLKLAIEEALYKAAPDLEGIETEGTVEPPPRPAGFVPLSSLRRSAPAEHGADVSARRSAR
jgi:Fe-S cluster biogenesis protein NfuA